MRGESHWGSVGNQTDHGLVRESGGHGMFFVFPVIRNAYARSKWIFWPERAPALPNRGLIKKRIVRYSRGIQNSLFIASAHKLRDYILLNFTRQQMNMQAIEPYEQLSATEYFAALDAVSPSEKEWRMLEVHASMPKFVITATQMADALGYRKFSTANVQYGKFAGKFCEFFGLWPSNNIQLLAEIKKIPGGDIGWYLRPNLIQALSLKRRSLVTDVDISIALGGDDLSLFEGDTSLTEVERAKRNQLARMRCVEHHGYSCLACGFNFAKHYGTIASEYIEVHHLFEFAASKIRREVNPITDLVPLCANCHRVAHRGKPLLSLSELRALLAEHMKLN